MENNFKPFIIKAPGRFKELPYDLTSLKEIVGDISQEIKCTLYAEKSGRTSPVHHRKETRELSVFVAESELWW